MKVAVVTEDGSTISRHFGRAPFYLVFTVEAGVVTAREQRPKSGHHTFVHEHHDQHQEREHGTDAESGAKHTQMLDPIQDCEAVIAGGMGRGAYLSIQQANMHPFLTELRNAEEAVRAYIDGTLVDHPERLH